MKDLKPLTLPAIWNMSFGFFGIQFGWGLQMANMSAIYQYLGASESDIPILWLAAPLTGLIVQPIIGYYSDRTWHKTLGRRRPYFLVGAILASLCLLAMPNSGALWMAAGLLWILDASVNVSMEPFRAFVADLMPPHQRQVGFAMQSLLIGLGAVLSSALPWLLTKLGMASDAAQAGVIPQSVRYAFYIGAVVYLLSVLYTIVTTQEFPPEPADAPAGSAAAPLGFVGEIWHGISHMPHVMRRLAWVQFFTWLGLFCMWIYFGPAIAHGVFGGNPGSPEYQRGIEWGGVCFATYNGVALDASFVLVALMEGGVFARIVRTVSAVIAVVGAVVGYFLLKSDQQSFAYGVAMLCAANLAIVAMTGGKKISPKGIHRIGLLCAGAGLLSTGFVHEPKLLLLSMAGVGIGWATILSMPYALLSNAIPPAQMGFYMGVFNFFIVLPQILAATLLGPIVQQLLGGRAIAAVMLGGASMVLAALALQRVPEAASTQTVGNL